jgi:hypothetical protein
MYTDCRDCCTFDLRICSGSGLLPEKKIGLSLHCVYVYSSVIIPQILLVILAFTFFPTYSLRILSLIGYYATQSINYCLLT